MKKRVLFLIQDLGGGGAEKVLVNLVNHLNQDIFDITVIALFGGGINEKNLASHIRYRTIWNRPFPKNSKILKLFSPEFLHKHIVKEHYDIEVAYLEGSAHRIISGCQDKTTKIYAWQHSRPLTEQNARIGYKSREEALKYYPRFTGIACVSETIRDSFCRWYPALTNTCVVYNTNDTDLIFRMAQEPLDFPLSDREIKICAVGKIVPLKRFDLVARIHKRLIEDGYPVHTYILGEGSEREKIRQYIDANGLEKTFTFAGYRDNPYNLMAKCDIFVCASENEGFSTATTEALLLGLAAVVTPVSGMEELLGRNNDYGIIAGMSEDELYAGIKRLLDSSALLAHYKKAAKERGSCFSTGNTVKAVEDMFLDLCDV